MAYEAHVKCVWQPLFRVAVEHNSIAEATQKRRMQMIAE
jgi:hypothetical protein